MGPEFDSDGVLKINEAVSLTQDDDGNASIRLLDQTLMIVPRKGLISLANALIRAHVRAGRLTKK